MQKSSLSMQKRLSDLTKRTLVILGVAVSLLLLSGCSGGDEDLYQPAELTSFKAQIELEKVWARSIGKGVNDHDIALSPVIINHALYAIDQKGLFFVVDKKNGDVLLKKKTNLSVSAGFATDGSRLFLATWNGELVCLDLNGKELWRSAIASEILAPPVVEGGTVVVQSADGDIHALGVSDGKKLWRHDVVQPVLTVRGSAVPLLVGGRVLVGLASGKVISLNTANGLPVWERTVSAPEGHSELDRLVDIKGALVADGWRCFGVSYQGKVFSLDMRSGALIWQERFSGLNGLSIDAGQLFLSESTGSVAAFEAEAGAPIWRQKQLGYRGLTQPMVETDAVVVGDMLGYLHWLSKKDGAFLARVKVDGDGIAAPVLIDSGMIYAFGKSGKLVAYRREVSSH